MYEFLFEPYILRCFLVILQFYDPNLFYIFRAVLKICFDPTL
jgi:hypothetical protein